MIKTTNSEADGVRERWENRADLGEAAAVLGSIVGGLGVGIAWLEGWLVDVLDWLRRGNNGVLVDTAGVVAGVVGIIFTAALLVLTRRSVRVAGWSVDAANEAVAEARRQRIDDMMPVLVAGSYWRPFDVPPADPKLPSAPDREGKIGIRISNAGPGVALGIRRLWDYAPHAPTQFLRIDDEDLPSALGSGEHYPVQISVTSDLDFVIAMTQDGPAPEGRTGHDVLIGTLELAYRDVHHRPGRSMYRVVYKWNYERLEGIECTELAVHVPGSF